MLPFLVISVLKQDFTVFTLFIVEGGKHWQKLPLTVLFRHNTFYWHQFKKSTRLKIKNQFIKTPYTLLYQLSVKYLLHVLITKSFGIGNP